ncbi:MAG: hypothetical protein ACFB01_06345 [Cohaesibacteraceae bacterium]
MTPERLVEAEARFETMVARLLDDQANELTPLAAGLLAASHSGYCSDSHTFSKRLGVEHALVIRECVMLADQLGAIRVERKNERSQRMVFSLTDAGLEMLGAVR